MVVIQGVKNPVMNHSLFSVRSVTCCSPSLPHLPTVSISWRQKLQKQTTTETLFHLIVTSGLHTSDTMYRCVRSSKLQITQECYNHVSVQTITLFTCVALVVGPSFLSHPVLFISLCPNPVEYLSGSRGSLHFWSAVALTESLPEHWERKQR